MTTHSFEAYAMPAPAVVRELGACNVYLSRDPATLRDGARKARIKRASVNMNLGVPSRMECTCSTSSDMTVSIAFLRDLLN